MITFPINSELLSQLLAKKNNSFVLRNLKTIDYHCFGATRTWNSSKIYLFPKSVLASQHFTIDDFAWCLQRDAADPVPPNLVLTYFYAGLRGFNGRFQEQTSQFKPGYYKNMLT